MQVENTVQAKSIIDDFERFLENGKAKKSNDPTYYYNMALISALQNEKTEMYQYIQAAIDAGWIKVWQVEFEPTLAKIKNEQQFNQMMGGVKARLATMRARSEDENAFLLANIKFPINLPVILAGL